MAVKIRLARKGRKKRPFYHILIADARAPRDGKFIEKVGTYDPTQKPAPVQLNEAAVLDWLAKGAQPTDTVRTILSRLGVLLRRHLQRGVDKGIITQETAEKRFTEWQEKARNKKRVPFQSLQTSSS